jgi:hypothetical protein
MTNGGRFGLTVKHMMVMYIDDGTDMLNTGQVQRGRHRPQHRRVVYIDIYLKTDAEMIVIDIGEDSYHLNLKTDADMPSMSPDRSDYQ